MTVKVYQHPFTEFSEAIRGKGSTANLIWYVTGTSDYSEARQGLYDEIADDFDLLLLKRVVLKQIGSELFMADLNYSDAVTSQPRYSFDTTGNTARVTHGYSELRYGPAGLGDPNVPPMDGALSVIDGKVEGVDIPIPGLKFQITQTIPRWFMSDAYVQVIENLTGSVNQNGYLGRPAQSLLFLGANGGQQAKGNPELTFFFVAGQYRTLQVGAIANIQKKPHQYMWPDWADDDDTGSKRLRKRCRGVYLNDVYPVYDWTPLTPPPEDAEEE